jgi:hypothetical protein
VESLELVQALQESASIIHGLPLQSLSLIYIPYEILGDACLTVPLSDTPSIFMPATTFFEPFLFINAFKLKTIGKLTHLQLSESPDGFSLVISVEPVCAVSDVMNCH